jgi:hypothetical protein
LPNPNLPQLLLSPSLPTAVLLTFQRWWIMQARVLIDTQKEKKKKREWQMNKMTDQRDRR